jgi:hypothetical protein
VKTRRLVTRLATLLGCGVATLVAQLGGTPAGFAAPSANPVQARGPRTCHLSLAGQQVNTPNFITSFSGTRNRVRHSFTVRTVRISNLRAGDCIEIVCYGCALGPRPHSNTIGEQVVAKRVATGAHFYLGGAELISQFLGSRCPCGRRQAGLWFYGQGGVGVTVQARGRRPLLKQYLFSRTGMLHNVYSGPIRSVLRAEM